MEVLLVDLVAFFKVGNKRDVPVFLETAWNIFKSRIINT